MSPPPAPSAEGTLHKTPLLHLLVYALDRRLAGTTTLSDPGGTEHAVYFHDGLPCKARTQPGVAPLDETLIAMGALDAGALAASLHVVSQRRLLHGQYLVSQGLITRTTLMAALCRQVAAKVGFMFGLPPETSYAFFEGENLLANWGGPELTPCAPLALVMSGVRAGGCDARLEQTLARLGTARLSLSPQARVELLGLDEAETEVVGWLRDVQPPLGDLIGSAVAPEPVVKQVVYALTIARCLELGAGRPPVGAGRTLPGRPAAGAARPAAAAPPDQAPTGAPVAGPEPAAAATRPAAAAAEPLAAEPVARQGGPGREEIEKKHAGLEDVTFFDLLGVDREVSAEQVESAYFRLAKSWHPDRLPAELGDLKPKVEKIFARIHEAVRTLSDDAKREEYIRVVDAGGGTARDQERVARAVDSALEFQKAEILFKRGDVEKAEVLVRRAVEADPDQPEYHTFLAWIEAEKLGLPQPGQEMRHYQKQLRALDKVIEKEPKYERALFYRAQLLKRRGEHEKAIEDFHKATALNPRNIDAAREVRLFKMRG
ncbi:MAG: DnaJ domain-containing protein, partial [Deltaproteobacteria bacterium]|nr:DnaJ domain-containing protein [Deltaproteobacteria bacterium]